MNRKSFLQLSALGLLAPALFSKPTTAPQRKLCFNTLACPDWSLPEIFENAQKMGYQAVEFRGILNEVDLLQSPYFQKSQRHKIKEMAANFDVNILNLNSSAVLHEYEPSKKNLNLDTAKRYIDMAQELDCPYIRVFPNYFPKEKTKAFALATIQENLAILADYCSGSRVKVLLDTHSDLVWATDISFVMQGMSNEHTGIIWDFFNMHLQTGESPEKMYHTLKDYISLVQLKDGYFKNDAATKYTLTGNGEVPIAEILALLDRTHYNGYLSFEWEKRWHPELAEPEIALPHFKRIVSMY
ncbi:sugar phosphate isomerase/epimerase family protein [Arenibacter sp. GZD96]|uniref:sugar phosphate isomerase/epimerase family protein n=1 Tax=Aurantibrevibacter litoralis TaxID=3106030 RepID=UPI002AFF2F0F|nr:sugar phosphate isomerase/epimerase family protein [Arenibacter sp. GZD-96]MEA1787453.1 sugar phosphate isomerase/epimerase family protein [Arenibacter sp. GZD-96]